MQARHIIYAMVEHLDERREPAEVAGEEGGGGLEAAVASKAARSPRKKVSRTLLNFWLDASLLVLLLTTAWSAVVVRFVFPPAAHAAGWTLWGWSYQQWSDFAFAALCLFALAVLLHVMLHWTWICGVVASHFLPRRNGKRRNVDDGTRTLWGVGLIIVLLNLMGLALAAAMLSVHGP